MRSIRDIAGFLASLPQWIEALRHVESLGLPDCWIGAGFIRNAVWDALHGREPDFASLSDIDVAYFDPTDISEHRDIALEQRLHALSPRPNWQVRNQARMHSRNGDAPYRDTSHAIAHWPETATAIAARLNDGDVELIAPHGIEDLLGLVVRPTPAFALKPDLYRKRIAGKDWGARWPRLSFIDP
ncbi:nucleotidyltransferase family protein [Microvirga flavescens]|uniref:nucleotidyltransferase family protein n=1 Tax=Microvirga flavescens TaxID=2249811 RepID=UPI000DD75B8B|nr:nucleotidyltransferase family protein [Microvirga flavescens]